MDIDFSAEELALADLNDCAPGDLIWGASLIARKNDLRVVAAFAERPESLALIALEGERAFRGAGFAATRQRASPVLKLPRTALCIRLDPSARTTDEQPVGTLLLTENGPFVYVEVRQQHAGFTDDAYLSLKDWSLHSHVANAAAKYGSWQLITRAVAGVPSTTIVSVGTTQS